MVDSNISLKMSEKVYHKVKQIAEESNRSIETVLEESIGVLFDEPSPHKNIDTLLDELKTYPDEQLWAVVKRRLSWMQSFRLRELREKAHLSELEQQEFDSLLDLVDNNMLLRSEALLLLKQRGYDVDTFFKSKDA